MTVTISPSDPRSMRALAVLATADRWVKGHTKDGRPFFVVPGSNGRVYWTDTRDCTCPDRRERDETCKHTRAVRLWALQHRATAPACKPVPAPTTEGQWVPCRACGFLVPPIARGLCQDCAADLLTDREATKVRLRAELGMAEVA